jgi:hypothetical protein
MADDFQISIEAMSFGLRSLIVNELTPASLPWYAVITYSGSEPLLNDYREF